MNTLFIKVSNCCKKGFSHVETVGLDYERVIVVNTDNEAVGFVLNPERRIVAVNEVLQSVDAGNIVVEKVSASVKTQTKCAVCNLNPLARFKHNIQLRKPVRGSRYATNEESKECEKEFIKTLISMGISYDAIYV
jgi:hypothetical protein